MTDKYFFVGRKNLRSVAVFVAQLFAFLWFSVAATAAPIAIQVDLDKSGGIIGPLNSVGDDFCPTSTTPGCDISDTDNRVRTNDSVSYSIAVQVDPPGDTVFVRATLKPGMVWTQMPGSCDAFTSSITGDGSTSSPSEVYCDLGPQSSWAANLLFFASVDSSLPNDSTVGLASAEIGGASSTTTAASLNSLSDLTVTATPRLNVTKLRHSYAPNTRGGISGVDLRYRVIVGLWDNDRNGNGADDPEPLLGNELVTQNLTFTEDLTNVSPNAYVYNCATSPNTNAFPYATFQSSYPNRSVMDAGSLSCSSTGTGATGSVGVTISGADLSFNNVPTQNKIGTSLTANYSYASYGIISIFVPLSDITAAGGSLAVENTYKDFNPVSITNQSNFNGEGEDLSDNTHAFTLQSQTGAFSHTKRCYVAGTNLPTNCVSPIWSGPPTNAAAVGAGDGTVQPEETFVTYTYYRNRSFIQDTNAEVCTVLDSRYYQPALYNANRVARCHGQCGTEGTNYVIEYGNGYESTTWQDAATTPSDSVRNECESTSAGWTSNLATAQASGDITKIRLRRLTPLNSGSSMGLATNLRVKPAVQLTGVPNATLLKSWGSTKNDTSWPTYRNCSYVSGSYPTPTHSRNNCGDRLALSRTLARISKTTLPGDTINVLEAGGQVFFKLSPVFTSIGGAIPDDITIVDTIPAGTEYVVNSATQNGAPFEPTITGNVNTGQTLTWDLGSINANTPIDPIEFAMTTPIFTTAGTTITNTVRIDAVTDESTVEQRSDTRTVTVTAPLSMLMNKTAAQPEIEVDGTLGFTVTYDNGTNSDFNEVDVIDILPYIGDGRFPATSYSGTTTLGAFSVESSNAQLYVSKDMSSIIQSNPNDSSNDFASGSTKWCPMTNANTVNPAANPTSGGSSADCPADGTEVRAFRIIDMQLLPSSQDRSFDFELITNGNAGGDIYTNQAHGTADTVSLSPQSPYATIKVKGKAELTASKAISIWDPNNDSLYALPGNDVIYTFTMSNIGDGPVATDSIFLSDSIPAEIEFWNGDIDFGGPNTFLGTHRIGFTQTIGTGVTYADNTDLRFYTGVGVPTSFANCTSVAADNSYRDDLTYLCLNPKGILSNGTPNPSIELSFRGRIK